ncbi:ParB N-terminal domain-containing protein [Pseudochrobactrum sp. AO18b]|uniref:ParB/RepB/Spo0J family partition protein n=1 Tax=Pseudochrobactrum sp. AO18b TaxID=1201036 RepID=UPI00039F711C|nr:ParB N-terminal domain-containing protein [Pseudochrobactrum sp. AO18b]
MTIREIALSNLLPDPLNVRKSMNTADLAILAASIRATGFKLLQNLVVRPAETKGDFFVTAGGRRLAALLRLAEAGEIKPDHKITCSVRTDADPVALSLIENEARASMSPLDQFAAFKALAENGATVEQIANTFNESVPTVQKRLALANVAPEILDAHLQDAISLPQLQAFAITDDHERQKSVLSLMRSEYYSPTRIRSALTNFEMATSTPAVRFVGLEAYKAAGGAVITDLFADDGGGVIVNPEIIGKLLDEKIEAVKEKIAAEGWAWSEMMGDHSDYYNWRRIYSKHRDLSEKEYAQLEAWEAEMAALPIEGDKPENIAALAEHDRISELYEALQDKKYSFDPEEMAYSGVFYTIRSDGELHFYHGYIRPEDDPERLKKASGAQVEDANGAVSQTLREDLTAHKNAAMIALMAKDVNTALVAVVHRLLISAHYSAGYYKSVLDISMNKVNTTSYMKQPDSSKAYDAYEAMKEEMGNILPADVDDLFDWLLDQNKTTLLSLLAYAAAPSISVIETRNQTSAPDKNDQLARALNLDMRDWWTPTADSYFRQVSRNEIQRTVGLLKGNDAEREVMQSSSKADAAKLAEKILKGTKWLPPLLQVSKPVNLDTSDEMPDAA